MKKLVSAMATLLLTFTGLTVASQPALAWTTPSAWDTSATIDLEVGVWTTLDWGCGEAGITNVSWDTGTLPDGLTIDSSGYVSGTPTTVGDSTLWGYKCTHGGSTGHIFTSHVTLHVHLPYSPTPTIALADLGDPACTAEFTVVLPMTPEAGSVSLTVTNGYNTVVVGLTDLTAGTTNIIDHPITNFGGISEDSRVTSLTPAVSDPFACGDFISATLSYRAIGREAANAGASSYIAGFFDPGPINFHGGSLDVANANNSSCTAHITGNLDATSDPGEPVNLFLSNGTTTMAWVLRAYTANEPISLELSLNDLSSFVDGVDVLSTNGGNGAGYLACGDLITAEIDYVSTGEPGVISDGFGDVITTPPPPTPAAHLTFSNPNDSSCDLHISGSFDTDSDQSTSVVLNVSNGTAHAAWILRGYSATETLSLDLSLNDISTFVDGTNVISLDSMNGSGGFSCGDTVTGSIVYISGGLPYFDEVTTGVTVTQYTPPPPPPAVDPTATISATYLGGSTCQIDVSGSFNVDVDHNSVSLIVENDGNGALVINLNDLVADEVYNLHLHLNDPDGVLGLSTQTTRDVFALSSGVFKCGDVISVFAYAEKNTNPFIGQTNQIVTIPQAHLSVTNLNDALCDLHIVGTIPVQADPGSIALDFSTETGTASASLGDYLPGTLIDLTFSMNDWNFESSPYIQDFYTSSGWAPECGDHMTTVLSYLVDGVPSGFTTIPDVTATRPIPTNAAPQASVVAIPSEQCSVVVSGIMPVELDSATLYVGDFGPYGSFVYFNLAGTPVGSPFSITIPMASPQDTRSPYISGSISTVGTYTCGSRISAEIDGRLGDVEVDGITSSGTQSELYCYPGKYQLDGACAPAQRGYFVDTANSRSQTPCPSGYNTPISGATSLGDCYNVLVQNIKDLKPPKAMMFKKVIGLPLTTTANVRAQVSATGPCTVSMVMPGAKVAGKKVKVATLAVTSTSVAGNCVLTFTSGESGQYEAFSKVVTIKVNRRGK